jgi:hypothetical protein
MAISASVHWIPAVAAIGVLSVHGTRYLLGKLLICPSVKDRTRRKEARAA